MAERVPEFLSPVASRRFWEGAAFAERFFMGLDEVIWGATRRTSDDDE